MTPDLFIKENITDWRDEVLQKEAVVKDDKDILDLIDDGVSTALIARSAIVSRELGEAPPDIVRPNKPLMMTGAMMDVSVIVKSQKHEVVTPSGKTYMSGDYIGKGKSKDDDDTPSYVEVQSEDGLRNAENYLANVIPGHIWNRFVNVVDAGGDVVPLAEALKLRIDDMIERIFEPVGE